jgi:Ca2+-binding EF-hand superfamily protein
MSDGSPDTLRQEFDRFDADGNGWIDEDEFAALVRALGVTFTPEKVAIAFMAIDVNGNGRIEFGEFTSWWQKRSA